VFLEEHLFLPFEGMGSLVIGRDEVVERSCWGLRKLAVASDWRLRMLNHIST
jgi:hypothetical protein